MQISRLLRRALWAAGVAVMRKMLKLELKRLGGTRVWLFTSWGGRAFGDNPKHFCQFIQREAADVLAVWIFYDTALVKIVKDQGFFAFSTDSLKGDAWASLAEVCIYSDWPAFGDGLSCDTLRVNLWHGMPMKDIGRLPQKSDIVTVTCKESKHVLSEVFGIALEKVSITGQAKCDILFQSIRRPAEFANWGPKCRIVTYMPTYRGSFKTVSECSRSNRSGVHLNECLHGSLKERFNALLEEQNLIFVIKPHLRNRLDPVDIPRVVVLDEYLKYGGALDSHELMAISDLFITDYSSVYFDYLLTGRPFIIYAPDLDSYTQSQKLYYDVSTLAAGSLAESEGALLHMLHRFLIDPDWNSLQRRALNDRFNLYQDDQSCRRIFMEIEARLGAKRE